MISLELPISERRRPLYRFFEILPGVVSYSAVILLVVLSIVRPLWASIYLLLVVLTVFVKAIAIAYNTLRGHRWLQQSGQVNWRERLEQLETPEQYLSHNWGAKQVKQFGHDIHVENLQALASGQYSYPLPSECLNAVIIAAYNESYDVLQPTLESVRKTTYNNQQIVIFLAYEARGGAEIEQTAKRLQAEYAGVFRDFQLSCHPEGLPDEVVGKGGNITYAGRRLREWCDRNQVEYSKVLVTTLDSDNRPAPGYFDYAMYEYVVRPDRLRLSYQPIALYFGNIWDTPAPMRVIAVGNSFWTIISSVRVRALRNFAAHSQPLQSLVEMGFWSTRSIVEDGHQYWRSYFHYRGDYEVIPIHLPIYQDAVMADTYKKTFIAQFKQLRRWGYGVSDIPYVATRLFTRQRVVPFWQGLARFMRLVDSHITLAVVALMVTLGGWVPLVLNSEASRDIVAHSLPVVISRIQQVAMIGIFISIFLMLKLLPPRPERYKRRRTVLMVLQWMLLPFTSIFFGSAASFTAQTRLMTGRYLDKFDVTDKATVESRHQAKQKAKAKSKI